ncbi:ABC transporter related protein [Desulforamulus reducens MI-1]|uniref:ABC transporter related protein n=1 Tax=Desulforamulus reducens (strain ATCC BAA-1160 / DSM 100696 / MI-1) TaxID=349161 RepID=A4J9F2_DESRM|nr:ABC transporter ATP-binding protein [Desulforamulus reducens]ABO51705.1 ABC transporter related protein [Desulforamulus reducens MI-1]
MLDHGLFVKAVSKSFHQNNQPVVMALDRVSLAVAAGEFVSILGPSGCGKSTLLDMVAGLSNPDEGDILLGKQSIVGKRGYVSYMPQSDLLFPWRTVLDNVIIPLQLQRIGIAEARKEALDLLPVFGLEKFAHSYPDMLSGGMRQRAALLRTYLCKRDLLLLDEPFGKLDALTKIQMQQWLLDIWEQFKPSVLFVTHDIDEAILLSDRIYLLSPRPGRLQAEIMVQLPRPRNPRITTNSAFARIKEKVYRYLENGLFNWEENRLHDTKQNVNIFRG